MIKILSALLLACSALALPRDVFPFASSKRRVLKSTPAGMPPRKFLPVPAGLTLPSCAPDPIWGTCKPTNNMLLSNTSNLTGAAYGGRTAAFIIAADAYCGQVPMGSASCLYPCASNGEVCALTGALRYGSYACIGSLAEQDTFCTAAKGPSKTLCNHTSVCQEMPGNPSQCIAKFKKNLLSNRSALSQYLSDFGTDRRDVWGCCEGSSAKWMNDVYCQRFSSFEGMCRNQTGCSFNKLSGDCGWSYNLWLEHSFGISKMTSALTDMTKQCAAITNRTQCSSHSPVTVSPTVIASILNFNLVSINFPVPASQCVVWESGDVL